MTKMRIRRHVDTYKQFSVVWILASLMYFRGWDNTAALASVLTVCSYSLMWQVKSNLFPDKNWEAEIELVPAVLLIWGPLLLYLIAPTVAMRSGADMSPWVAHLFLFTFMWGIFLMFTSDCHKYVALKMRPGLITDGLWSLSRNINYFGELLVYIAFVGIPAVAMGSFLPLLPLIFSVSASWYPNMVKKDKSMSRHPEFAAWKKRTAFFIPFLW